MKRIVLLGAFLALLLVSGIVISGDGIKRIDKVSGVDTIVLTGATDSAYYQTNMFQIVNDDHNTKYDAVIGAIYIPGVSENLDISGVDNEGKAESVFVAWVTESPYYRDTLFCDTCVDAPCTLWIRYDERLMYSGVYGATVMKSDTVGAHFVPNDSVTPGLNLDNFYISMYGTDTAAHSAGDTLEFIVTWWVRFLERY